jgi:hypothetical protein
VLLGKILRIDIDHADPIALTPYSSPSDNPYVGMPGRDEIFSIGWRNPWRFSFDRSTHQQWVGDVGQGSREEVDTPIAKGGNYGWRVYEGTSCTNNDPTLCNPANYIFPIFEYAHSGSRCSITGGYVYRGTQGTLPPGTYVYGDYCTGEIFAWNGVSQSLLLDTAFNISSFGEDERGELYVVNLGGSVSRIARSPLCTYSLSPTDLSNRAAAGGAANITVTTPVDCPVAATSYQPWVTVNSITTNGGTTTVALQISANIGGPTRATSIVVAGRLFLITQLGS